MLRHISVYKFVHIVIAGSNMSEERGHVLVMTQNSQKWDVFLACSSLTFRNMLRNLKEGIQK